MLGNIRRLLITVRFLKIRQVSSRIFRKLHSPRRPRIRGFQRAESTSDWLQPASHPPAMIARMSFSFLNTVHDVKTARDWDSADRTKLWRYNLHYFADLVADDAVHRLDWHIEYLSCWVDHNPFPVGSGWEPYPTSLRIVNWIKWSLAGNEPREAWSKSLAFQAEWLYRNIEWHLLGNHLFENARALYFAGLYFDTPESKRWLEKGEGILRREIDEQILADGGHFELSPMYHSIVLEGVLDLLNISRAFASKSSEELASKFESTASSMLSWLESMVHPDDEISLFNDAAFGIAAKPAALKDYARRLGLQWEKPETEISFLSESGYVRVACSDAVLIADVGPIGPDYLPGHAHADSLGFEFSLFGQRLFVDTGCSTYEDSEERLRQRGTAAHNTVVVGGKNSSEVWSSFRVAERARPRDVEVSDEESGFRVTAAHDGYDRLSPGLLHRRNWKLKSNCLEIRDDLEGETLPARALFLVPSEWQPTLDREEVVLQVLGRDVRMRVAGGRFALQSASWHPEFGISRPAISVQVLFTSVSLTTSITW